MKNPDRVVSITHHKNNKSQQPLVSILCITYNQVNYIRDTLNGFLIQQTSFPVEIIIHDDASQDGTQKVIKEFETLYPNIIIPIYQKENQFSQKVDFVKEFIFPKINGKYIATCEGDDYWIDPLKLQKQVYFLEQNKEYGLIYTNINTVDKNNLLLKHNFLSDKKSASYESFEDYLINAPFIAPCSWLFRRDLQKGDDKNKGVYNYVVADLPILLDIVAKSKIYFLNDTTTHYRVLSNSASHFTNIDDFYSFSKGIYNIQLDYAEKYQVEEDVIDAIKEKFVARFYNFAVANHDLVQIEIANKLLMKRESLSFKFKVAIFLSNFKLGRIIVRYRLINRLGYNKIKKKSLR